MTARHNTSILLTENTLHFKKRIKKMKTLGINIDGVLRNFIEKFDQHYRKVFINNPSLVSMNHTDVTLQTLTDEEQQALEERIKEKELELLTLPVDSGNLLNHYKFNPKNITMSKLDEHKGIEGINLDPIEYTPQQAMEKFLFEDYPFIIYGQADEYKGAMEAVNKLQFLGLSKNLFNVVLLSTLKSKAIAPTYFFLGKEHCRIREVKFVDSDVDKWNHCDVLIDVVPESFQNKPSGKTSVKINHPSNKWESADYSYEHIKEFCNQAVLDKIFKNDK